MTAIGDFSLTARAWGGRSDWHLESGLLEVGPPEMPDSPIAAVNFSTIRVPEGADDSWWDAVLSAPGEPWLDPGMADDLMTLGKSGLVDARQITVVSILATSRGQLADSVAQDAEAAALRAVALLRAADLPGSPAAVVCSSDVPCTSLGPIVNVDTPEDMSSVLESAGYRPLGAGALYVAGGTVSSTHGTWPQPVA